MTGQAVAHYRVGQKIGAGGMGEVYRATDTKLGRDIALKVLPAALTDDPERMARFRREAQILASLNHPNIATIFGLEEGQGVRALAMELVEGPTLAEQIARGPMPVAEALPVARQIAEALEYAHERGIVHRDLKPANVKLTPEGKVKVLDFGLAKAFADDPASSVDLSRSPTLSLAATRAGVVLGTAGYMSPEQAKGKEADKRSDIWSFGVVLLEMLTGKQGFQGETASEVMAAVILKDAEVPTTLPSAVQRLLRRCLTKDPRARLRDIGEARIALEEINTAEPAPAVPAAAIAPQPKRRWVWIASAVAAAALIAAAAMWFWLRPAPPLVSRLVIALPASAPIAQVSVGSSVALSPDGRKLVYVVSAGGSSHLALRALDQFDPTPMPGTEGAAAPFFSPDGQWVAFFAGGKLKKVAVTGGAPLTLCDAGGQRGGAWAGDTIYFSPAPNGPLVRVSSAGGTPQPFTKLGKNTRGHRWPQVLPGGKAVLFTIWAGGGMDAARIGVASVKTGEEQVLVEGGSYARYSPTGHLVYARQGGLLAVPFDLAELRVTGPPFPILEGVTTLGVNGTAHFSMASDGSLVYVAGSARDEERSLLWADRKGTAELLTQTKHAYSYPRISPDGKRVAMVYVAAQLSDVWVHETSRDTQTRLTFQGDNWLPVWSPDGKWIAYASNKAGVPNIYRKPADGSGAEERLMTSDKSQFPSSWSSDGKYIAFMENDSKTGWDIGVLPLEGDRKPRPFLVTPYNEMAPAFSPDGHWIAYSSTESGRVQVYVQPFPGPGGKWQISTDGGITPQWASNGREIVYRNGDKFMSSAVQTSPAFAATKPVMLFEGHYADVTTFPDYDVTPDGRRLLLLKGGEEQTAVTQLHLIQNWFEELRQGVAKGK